MNAMLEKRVIELIHQMNDKELYHVLDFIEKAKNNTSSSKGLGTRLHQQFKDIWLVNAGFELPERPLEAERVSF